MEHRDVSRRTLLKGGGAALAGLSLQVAGPAHAFQRDDDREQHAWDDDQPDPSQSLGQPGDVVLPWLDQPPPFPRPGYSPEASSSGRSSTPGSPLPRSSISSRTTVYRLALTTLPRGAWRCRPGQASLVIVAGRTQGPPAPRNRLHIGVLRQPWHRAALCHWLHRECPLGRTPLAPVLEEAGLLEGAVEIVFYGIDRGTQVDPRQLRDRERWADGRRRTGCGWRTGFDDHRAVRPQHVARRCARPAQPALLRNERRAPSRKERFPDPPDRSGLVWRGQRQMADAHRGTQSAPCGELHGARLRDHPRGAAQRPAALDIQHREARSPQVSPSKSRTSRQPLRRPWRRLGCADRGSASPHRQRTVAAGEALRARWPTTGTSAAWRGDSGRSAGECPPRPAHGDVQGIRRRRQRAAGAGRSVPCQQSDLLGEQRTHHTPGSHSLIATTVAIGRSEAGGHRIGAAAARYRPRDRTLVACGQAVDPRDTEGELVRARPLLRRDHRRCLVADWRGRPPGDAVRQAAQRTVSFTGKPCKCT